MSASKLRLLAVFAVLVDAAAAQSLPPPSRTVYKCEVAGKVVYSDSPCLGAQRVDIEPTRGLNKSSGAERIGSDVRNERSSEAMAEALRPVFNESAEQREKRHRRAKLLPATQLQCSKLDAQVAAAETEETQRPQGQARAAIQQRLYGLRLKFSQLKC
jgi:hypothetical protein